MTLCKPWIDGAAVSKRPGTDGIDEATLQGASEDACDLLYGLSGRQFPGVCSRVIRPAARPLNIDALTWVRYLDEIGYTGGWSEGWGACNAARFGDHVGCTESRMLDLQVYPLTGAVVTIDGEELQGSPGGGAAGDAWRIDMDRLLVRQDGEMWPTCQDITLPAGEPGTFVVEAEFGADPPSSAIGAATTFAAELAKARSGKTNKLPSRVQTITRQDIAMTVLDPMQFIQAGLTGIYEVDLFIRTVNPSRAASPPLVYSPDVRRMHVT